MTTHIFIATTQGLVAIQNITPIDDEDISSVVSVNGTSTTANISGNYHNFVKKGVGIIHQMFGACSYRVDISARIDQGNSWQVAMYLAHLAQSQGLLGNGEVSQGDTVICATGEVNTTNQQVLAVAEVAVKFKLALPQLKQWTALGTDVLFLLPQANQSDVEHLPHMQTYSQVVNNLEQAAATLPSNSKNKSEARITSNKLVSTNSRYIIAAAIAIMLLLVFYGLSKLTSTASSHHPSAIKKPYASKVELTTKVQLVALLKQGKTCVQTSRLELALTSNNFADLALNKLCELYFQTPSSHHQLLLIARDAYTVLPLTQSPQGWKIPLPKNRLSDRSYFLVSLTHTISEDKIEQLRLYREAMPKAKMLTESLLAKWLSKQQVEFSVYSHKLLVQ